MIDMSSKKDNKSDYIIYLDRILDTTSVMYADGTTKSEDYSKHNYNVYRHKLMNQVDMYSEKYISKLSKESFLLFLHKWSPIVASVIGMYFAYNCDISNVSKIVIGCILLAINGVNLLANELWCGILADKLDKVYAYQFYNKNSNTFINKDNMDFNFILPIEDIDNHDLTLNQLIEIKNTIENYKKEYEEDLEGISLSYKKSSK